MLLRKVHCFLAVARRGSFTAAAELLNMSQPALGAHVRELEERHGVTLFERHGRGARLTPAGQEFLPVAEALAAQAERAQAVLRSLGAAKAEPLRLGMAPTAQATLAPSLLHSGAAQAFFTDLLIQEGLSDDLKRRTESGEIDAALCYGLAEEAGDRMLPLYSESLYLVGRPGALGRRRSIRFAELAGLPLMMERRYQVFRRLIERVAAERNVVLDARHEVEPTEVKRALIQRHGSFAIAPYGLFLGEIARGEMTAWRVTAPALDVTLFLAERPRLPESVRPALARWVAACVSATAPTRDLRWRLHALS